MTLSYLEYAEYDATGLAELVATREIQATELIEIAIHVIERLNPHLNAVIQKMYDHARQQLTLGNTGTFYGVPFLLKDLQAIYAGIPTSAGSRLIMPIPSHDSELVTRYKKAGLIILGKTNVPEFGLSPSTEPVAFGPTLNPWNFKLTSGGSSGGSATAVASGMVPAAHGNDGGGSIRIPSAYCGLVGLKPSRGRIPSGPYIGRCLQGLAVEHVLTRSVRDCAALLDATCGPDLGEPFYLAKPKMTFLESLSTSLQPLKIAYTTDPFIVTPVDVQHVSAVEQTAKLCAELGHRVDETESFKMSKEEVFAAWVVFCSDVSALIYHLCELRGEPPKRRELETNTLLAYQFGRDISARVLARSIQKLDLMGRRFAQVFCKYDVLLTPTMPMPPISIGEISDKGMRKVFMRVLSWCNLHTIHQMLIRPSFVEDHLFSYTAFTLLCNITGQPAINLPVAWYSNGLPLGCQFIAKIAQERTLLQLAAQLERAQPWQEKHKALHHKLLKLM